MARGFHERRPVAVPDLEDRHFKRISPDPMDRLLVVPARGAAHLEIPGGDRYTARLKEFTSTHSGRVPVKDIRSGLTGLDGHARAAKSARAEPDDQRPGEHGSDFDLRRTQAKGKPTRASTRFPGGVRRGRH